jgi:hypothetical protein
MIRQSLIKSNLLLWLAIGALVAAGALDFLGFLRQGRHLELHLTRAHRIITVEDDGPGILTFGVVLGDGDFHVLGPETTFRIGLIFCVGYVYPGTKLSPAGCFIEASYWLWSLFVACIALMCYSIRSKVRPNPNPDLCRKCDYDLRAHHPGQKCPECGTEITPDQREGPATFFGLIRSRIFLWLIIAAILFAAFRTTWTWMWPWE